MSKKNINISNFTKLKPNLNISFDQYEEFQSMRYEITKINLYLKSIEKDYINCSLFSQINVICNHEDVKNISLIKTETAGCEVIRFVINFNNEQQLIYFKNLSIEESLLKYKMPDKLKKDLRNFHSLFNDIQSNYEDTILFPIFNNKTNTQKIIFDKKSFTDNLQGILKDKYIINHFRGKLNSTYSPDNKANNKVKKI